MQQHVEVVANCDNHPMLGSDSEESAGPSGSPSLPFVVKSAPKRPEALYLEDRWRPMSFCATLKAVLLSNSVVGTAHWLLTLSVIILFTTSTVLDPWRNFWVDRRALVSLWRSGKIPGSVLNSSLAITRGQGMQMECFYSEPSELIFCLTRCCIFRDCLYFLQESFLMKRFYPSPDVTAFSRKYQFENLT